MDSAIIRIGIFIVVIVCIWSFTIKSLLKTRNVFIIATSIIIPIIISAIPMIVKCIEKVYPDDCAWAKSFLIADLAITFAILTPTIYLVLTIIHKIWLKFRNKKNL